AIEWYAARDIGRITPAVKGEVSRGRGVDGVRRPCNARQIRARGSDLDDSAGILSAGQTNLFDGDVAEARARVYPDGNLTVCTRSKGARKDAIQIELHAFSRGESGRECAKGASHVLVNDLM